MPYESRKDNKEAKISPFHEKAFKGLKKSELVLNFAINSLNENFNGHLSVSH